MTGGDILPLLLSEVGGPGHMLDRVMCATLIGPLEILSVRTSYIGNLQTSAQLCMTVGLQESEFSRIVHPEVAQLWSFCMYGQRKL